MLTVAAMLALCAACYRLGEWHARMELQAAVSAELPARLARAGLATPAADPLAQARPVITPLNVLDPTALVMGPGAPSPQSAPPPPAPAPLEDWRRALRQAVKK